MEKLHHIGQLSVSCFTRDSDDIHVGEIILKEVEYVLNALGYHIHPHCITSAAAKPYVQVPPCHRAFYTLQPCKSA